MSQNTFAKLLFVFGCLVAVVGTIETGSCVADGEFGEASLGLACVSFAIWRCWKKLPYLRTVRPSGRRGIHP